MTKNDGKYLEKIVELLENSIDPGATVKHDVDMPILTSKEGHTTQCDVVIWSGEKPREFITICEVQDRPGKAMPPQDVRGFKRKIEEIGAQRVICISRNSFSDSNKERAAQSGGSIILMTINDWNIDSLPFKFININLSHREFSLTELCSPDLLFEELSQSEVDKLNVVPFMVRDKIFSFDKVNLFSLSELCSNTFIGSEKKNIEGESTLDTGKDGIPQLFINANNEFHKITIKLVFKYKLGVTPIKPYMLSYEQDGQGALAWYLEANHESKNGLVSMKIPVVKFGEHFCINQVEVEMPITCTFNINVQKG